MPTLKLTEKSVDRIALSDDDHPVEYYDTRLAGFGVRAGLRSKTYFVKGRVAGKQFKRSLGKVGLMTYDAAVAEATRLLSDASGGVSPDDREQHEKQADEITFRVVLDKYMAARKSLKPRTRDLYRKCFDWYLSKWLDLPMRSVTPAMVEAKHTEVGKRSPAMADGTFRVVRALYNYAMDVYEDDIIRNPVKRLSSTKAWYKVPRKKTFVKPTQLPLFFERLRMFPGVVADYLELLLFTGVRSQSEIARLQIRDVDFKERTIDLHDTKTKELLVVPVCRSALAVLRRRVDDARQQGVPFLFYAYQEQAARNGEYVAKHPPKPLGWAYGTIETIFKDTELQDLTPHDLRRTFLSYADELEISNVVQKRLVGHAIPTDVTDGYKVLTMERLHRAVAKVEAFVLENRGVKVC